MTQAWDPKNIELQFRVVGDCHVGLGLAIDLTTNEVIMLNIMRDSQQIVVNPREFEVIKKYLNPANLELNCGMVADLRAEFSAAAPEDATIVFDDTYQPHEGQTVVRTWELEKLVALVNGGKVNG